MEVDQKNALISTYKISCTNVPQELLLKNVAKQHFRQFGRILRLIIKPKSRIIVVEYNSETSVQRALHQGGEFNGKTFTITRELKPKMTKKKVPKKETDPEWVPDPEVMSELEAMGDFTKKYSLRPERMVVDPIPPKLTVKKKSIKTKPTKSVSVKASSNLKPSERNELIKTLKQPAMTAEEKYKVLEARDKLLRSETKRLTDIKTASQMVGTCPDMCPEKERLMREAQHQVAIYEQEPGSRSMDPKLAVKQYSRSSADQEFPLAHELRPVNVLQLTMCYLMHRIMNLCGTSDVNMGEWYHFLWDRTRGIRKDITQQELCCQASVELVEQCARFHIHCSARLVAEDPSVFDHKINTENLTKCLQTLKYMYHDLKIKGVSCPNEAEFRAYIILLNLNDGNFMWELQQFKADIQKSSQVRFALQVYSAIDKNNYIKFFKLVNSTTYLNACILLRYFTQVRISALKTILKCYAPRAPNSQYPLAELMNILAFEDVESMTDFLNYFSLSTNPERTHLLLDRKMLILPELPYTLERAIKVVESKRSCSVGEIVCGSALPPPYFENHIPQNSFSNGFLNLSDIMNDIESDDITENEALLEDSAEENTDSVECKSVFKVPVESEKRSNSPLVSTDVVDQVPKSEPFWISKQNIFQAPTREKSPLATNMFVNTKPPVTKSIFSSSFIKPPITSVFEPIKPLASVFSVKPPETSVFNEKPPPSSSIFSVAKSQQNQEIVQVEKSQDDANFLPKTRPNITEVFSVKKSEDVKDKLSTNDDVTHKKPSQFKMEEPVKDAERERKELEKRALIKKQQHELQIKKKEEERKKRELIKKKAEIIFTKELDVFLSSIAREVLVEIENKRRDEKLQKIASNIKKHKLKLVFTKWHKKVITIRRKRKAVEFSPCCLPTRTLQQEADELYSVSQDETLTHRKRYKCGRALNLVPREEKEIQKIDLFDLTYHSLIKKYSQLDQLQKEIYWKISVSLPTLAEVPYSPNRIEETLDEFFQWEERNGSVNFMEQVRLSGLQQITYCLEKQCSQPIDSNGIIFVTYDFNKAFISRLVNSLKTIKHTVPITVVVQQNDFDGAEMEMLKHKCVCDYKIFTGCFTQKNLINLVENSLVFLAQNAQATPTLELDTLKSFLQKNLCTELWRRVLSYSKWNSDYKSCLQSPDVVIDLYNQALTSLKEIIFKKSNFDFPTFPPVFQEFMKSQLPDYLPCDYKYFPAFWKEEQYQKALLRLVEFFALPTFNEEWPPQNSSELEKTLVQFCESAFKQHTLAFYKIIAIILNSVDLEDFTNINKLVWTNVIEVMVSCKMNETDFSIQENFVHRSIFSQYFVVYNSKDVDEYNKSTWFYVNNPTVQKKMKLCHKQPKITRPPSMKPLYDNFSVDFDLDKALKDILSNRTEQDEKLRKRKAEMEEVENMLKDLEETVKVQKLINRKFDETFQKVLKDS